MNKMTFAEWMKINYPNEILLENEYDEYNNEYIEYINGTIESNLDIKDILKDIKHYKPVSIKKIVNDVIRKDLRAEAMTILSIASPFRINELTRYYNEGKENIVCMHIDTIKEELVFYKLMEQKETDTFGKKYF